MARGKEKAYVVAALGIFSSHRPINVRCWDFAVYSYRDPGDSRPLRIENIDTYLTYSALSTWYVVL